MTDQCLPIHDLSPRQIISKCMSAWQQNILFDRALEQETKDFLTSIDRFAVIAYRLRCAPIVLDVGSSTGILAAILKMLGHEVYAVDFFDQSLRNVYVKSRIIFHVCNIEADPLPFESEFFDAVTCCQTLEHFTHAHLLPVVEMKRVLKPRGLLEIDVPNAVGIRNRWRVIRGKHLTWDYEKHYLNPRASMYRGREYYPDRHNREFTKDELSLLLHRAGFSKVEVEYLRDETVRLGPSKLKSIGSWIRNTWPQGRKTLMGIGIKEATD